MPAPSRTETTAPRAHALSSDPYMANGSQFAYRQYRRGLLYQHQRDYEGGPGNREPTAASRCAWGSSRAARGLPMIAKLGAGLVALRFEVIGHAPSVACVWLIRPLQQRSRG